MKETLSIYGAYISEYISYRISNGFSASTFDKLYMFDRFLAEKNYNQKILTKEIIDEWDKRRETESNVTQLKRISTVRIFCIYLNSIGIQAHVSRTSVKVVKTVPFVFTRKEIINLFKELDKYFRTKSHHYRYMMPVLFRLMYTTGMRVGEAVSLRHEHIDLKRNVIVVENGKNKLIRLVYMSDDVSSMMSDYMKKIFNEKSLSQWLFPSTKADKHIASSTVADYFSRVIRKMGYTNPDYHPVPHSLRHSYCVHVIDGWIRNGENLNELMPYLEKQMGHKNHKSTWYYYHMVYDSYECVVTKTRNIYPEVSDDD